MTIGKERDSQNVPLFNSYHHEKRVLQNHRNFEISLLSKALTIFLGYTARKSHQLLKQLIA